MIFNKRYKIVLLGDKRLRELSSKVPLKDIKKKGFQSFLDDMLKIMIKDRGAGLAAPQIGVFDRVFVIDPKLIDKSESSSEIQNIFINPEILSKSSQEKIGLEGCLSIPNLYGDVSRSTKITVRAFDRYGKQFELEAKDFYARVIYHEYDHLDGTLFIDRVRDIKTLRIENN